MIRSALHVIPYARRHRDAVLRLVDSAFRIHVHLDWYTVDEWIDDLNLPMFLAWDDRDLVGVMAAALPLGGASWLRLVVIDEDVDAQPIINILWEATQLRLRELGADQIGALLLRMWIVQHLEQIGFTHLQDIVTLSRAGLTLPPALATGIHIRVADWNDVPIAVKIDHIAFDPIWRMSAPSIRQAVRSASNFTIAEMEGEPIGYQLSTQHRDGAHLARLAVLPDAQGHGIGGALVGASIRSYLRHGISTMSVNTQALNAQSLSVYRRYGFERNGLDMPVYWTAL